MADVTRTAADVSPLDIPAMIERCQLNAAATVGAPVYNVGSVANGVPLVAEADADIGTLSRAIGILVAIISHGDREGVTVGAAGDPCDVLVYGPMAGFSGMTPGEPLYVSTNVGRIAPRGDLTTGDYVTQMGRAKTATEFFVMPSWFAQDSGEL